jgi:ATP-binding cassette subfamily B protein
MHRLYQQVQAAFSDLTETVRERFAGIRIIKAHNLERLEIKGLNKISRRYIKMNLNLAKITRSFFPMMLFFANLSLVIVLYLGGKQTIFFSITPGDFVAFISYLGLLTWPMMALGWVVNLIQRGGASLDRIDAILKTEADIINPTDPSPNPTFKGNITLENVSFSYRNEAAKPGESTVLKGINIRVAPGETLGVVGPPGSGKTSLLNLICRIYNISEGSIQIDGIDIRRLSVDDLRSQISFMPQEAFLFASTIRHNITFGNTDANEDDLIAAVKQASLDDTINTFSKGLDTLVGEKGVILSGGQKQRITLARALMKKSPILILDDPVSQVDVETGDAIVRNLRSLGRSSDVFQTMIIVSHRLSAVQFAERIIALDQGRIVEAGTHDELMHHNEYYAKTYHLQAIEEAYRAR